MPQLILMKLLQESFEKKSGRRTARTPWLSRASYYNKTPTIHQALSFSLISKLPQLLP